MPAYDMKFWNLKKIYLYFKNHRSYIKILFFIIYLIISIGSVGYSSLILLIYYLQYKKDY